MLPSLSAEREGRVDTPVQFFYALGNLHDARIESIEWNVLQQEIALVVDDLYSNFEGFAEYPGRQMARLSLRHVSKWESDIVPDRFPVAILDFEVEEDPSRLMLRVRVRTGIGVVRVECKSICGRCL